MPVWHGLAPASGGRLRTPALPVPSTAPSPGWQRQTGMKENRCMTPVRGGANTHLETKTSVLNGQVVLTEHSLRGTRCDDSNMPKLCQLKLNLIKFNQSQFIKSSTTYKRTTRDGKHRLHFVGTLSSWVNAYLSIPMAGYLHSITII